MDLLTVVATTYLLQAAGAWVVIDPRQPIFRRTVAGLWLCATLSLLLLGISFASFMIQFGLACLAGTATMLAKAEAQAWRSTHQRAESGGQRSGHDRG